MKNYIVFFSLFSIVTFGQSAMNVKECANYLGKGFASFEKDMKLPPQDISSKFGLDKRIYKKDGVIYSTQEINDDELIGQVVIAKMRDSRNHEIWYNIAKDFNSDPLYKFSGILLKTADVDYVSKDLSYDELILYLRKENNTSKLTYNIVYTKNEIEYSLSMFEDSLYITLQKTKQ